MRARGASKRKAGRRGAARRGAAAARRAGRVRSGAAPDAQVPFSWRLPWIASVTGQQGITASAIGTRRVDGTSGDGAMAA